MRKGLPEQSRHPNVQGREEGRENTTMELHTYDHTKTFTENYQGNIKILIISEKLQYIRLFFINFQVDV